MSMLSAAWNAPRESLLLVNLDGLGLRVSNEELTLYSNQHRIIRASQKQHRATEHGQE